MRRYLPFVIVAVVALTTLATATLLYRAKRQPTLTISGNPASPDRAKELHVRGDPNAPVTLEEYGDFECPPCGKLSDPINQIEKDYRPQVRLIYRNFPLAPHAHARPAAIAAEAAGLQNRFWEMHDLLYREQSVWSKAPDVQQLFSSYAGILGLDVARFKKDIENDEVKARVEADQKQGDSLGVQNTPTIFVNNRAVDPKLLNPDSLRAAVVAAVKEKSSSSR